MVFKWLTTETKSAYIARPLQSDGKIIVLHPDKSIPRGAKITVRSDECALFFREGEFVGRLDAGTYLLDTNNVPFLGHLLIDKFTDANHFITQVFFVTMAECVTVLPNVALGQYIDRNSRNVVSIHGSSSYTLQVMDPVKLVTQLGGQTASSGATTIEVLNGRLLNGLRRIVGELVESRNVLEVVSNTQVEAISTRLQASAEKEFEEIGVKLRRVIVLTLGLDDDSMALLRDFGKQEAGLRIQAKGAELAQQAGFADFNIVQGQRAALEGLGKGLADGKNSMFMGMGLGGDLTGGRTLRPGAMARPSGNPARASGAPTLSTPRNFLVQTPSGETGPYSARQVALLIISTKRSLAEVLVRGGDDPADAYFPAEAEPQIAAEFRRRTPAGGQAGDSRMNAETNAFVVAFEAAVADGVISPDELSMLAKLAVAVGLARDGDSARQLVADRARERGIRVE